MFFKGTLKKIMIVGKHFLCVFLTISLGGLLFQDVLAAPSGLPKPQVTQAIPSRLSLKHFIHQVWQKNPEVQAAKAHIAAAMANATASSLAIYNPDLELEGEQVHKGSREDTYTLGISQTIDWGDKRGARHQVGQDKLVEAKALFAEKELQLGVDVLRIITVYQAQQQVVQYAKRQTMLLRTFYQETERKFKSGDVAQVALDQARLAYSGAIAEQADMEFSLNEAKQNLVIITQIPPKQWPTLPDALPKLESPSLNEQTELLTQVPRLRVLNAQVAEANAAIKVAEAQTHADPTVTVKAGAEDNEALVNIGLSVPLFMRNNFRAEVESSSHNAVVIEKLRLNAYQRAKAQLSGTLQRYQMLRAAYQRWQRTSRESLNGGMRLLDRLWEAGELNTTDYLIQVKQRVESQIAGRQLQGEVWEAWFEWLNASGELKQWLQERRIKGSQ